MIDVCLIMLMEIRCHKDKFYHLKGVYEFLERWKRLWLRSLSERLAVASHFYFSLISLPGDILRHVAQQAEMPTICSLACS